MKKKQTTSAKKHKMKREIDPICGMDVSELHDGVRAKYKSKVYHFCEPSCQKRFKDNPERYLGEPLIKLRNVWKVFSGGGIDTKALQGLDLNIWEGDFVSIIGVSGSGKSTLLNMIGLLDLSSSGRIVLKGKEAEHLKDEERAKMRSETFGFVFQQYNLIPWLTAYENITLPLIFAGKKNNHEELDKRIKMIGIEDRINHRPYELSGGEQQRVALLRALANGPEIILGDEPTGNLDSKTGAMILDLLISLNKEQKKTLIIVTHDPEIAAKSDLIVSIRDGKQIQDNKLHK